MGGKWLAGTLLTLQAAYRTGALNMGQRPTDMMQCNTRKDLPVNKLPNVDSYIIAYFATWRSTTKVNFQILQTFSQLQNRWGGGKGDKKRNGLPRIAGELSDTQRTV